MSYEQTTAPTVNAISDQEAKDQSRNELTDEDTLVGVYVDIAQNYAESSTNIQFITATWKLRLEEFPTGNEPIIFERNPVQSITSIEYVDTDGNSQTWDSSKYEVDTKSMPGKVRPINTESYPSTKDQYDAVTITFVAGYGDATTDVPDTWRGGLQLMVAYLFENRDPVHTVNGESVAVAWPESVERMLSLGSLKNMK